MDVFNLFAKLTLDSDGFDRGVNEAEKSGKGLASSLEGTFSKIKKFAAGALSVVALKKGFDAVMDLANATADYGDKVDKQSQALGLSRKAYQEWEYILGQNGASIDSLSFSMRTLNSLVLSAADGSKESKNAFAELGVGIHEIERLNPEEQFEAVVRAFQKMPAGAQKSALAIKIFGRNGTALLPLLNQSETSIDELRARAAELGLVMSDDAVDAAVTYGDSLDDLQRTFNAFKYAIGAKILPVLTTGIQKITNYARKLRIAYEDNGLAGVWDTLVESFKNIKWPTQEEIIGKIKELWEGVKTAAKNVLKLIFGESADGDIEWPTAEQIESKVKNGLTSMWKGVQTLATSILKLVFGEDKDGGIAFPSSEAIWEKIKGGLGTLWSGIQALATGVLKFVFGETEDGGIAWPTSDELWGKISGGLTGLWNGVKALASGVLKLVFGEDEDGGITWPTAEEVWKKIKSGLIAMWNGVKESAKSILRLMLGTPELPDAHSAGEALRKKIREWWDSIKENFKNVLKWFVPDPSMGDADGSGLKEKIKTWWDEKVKPDLKNILNFVLGLFDLPNVDEMKQKIVAWWDSVKAAVGNLIVNIVPNIPNILGVGGNSVNGIPTQSIADTANDTKGYNKQSMNVLLNSLFGHAKGLNYVPFDGYPALLHRGEQVLTASQARRRNNGQIDMSALFSGLIGAVREGMNGAQLNSYMDSTKVTSKTNDVTGRKLISRRFAPA